MKKNLMFALATGVLFLAGCSQEAQQKMDAAGDNAAKAADQTGDAVATDANKAGQAIERGAENAGEAVKGAAEDAAQATDNAGMTLKIKNAILSAENLDATDLNVDTKDKTVILKGWVPNAENKKRAESIAKNTVGNEYTVRNELQIGNH